MLCKFKTVSAAFNYCVYITDNRIHSVHSTICSSFIDHYDTKRVDIFKTFKELLEMNCVVFALSLSLSLSSSLISSSFTQFNVLSCDSNASRFFLCWSCIFVCVCVYFIRNLCRAKLMNDSELKSRSIMTHLVNFVIQSNFFFYSVKYGNLII